jgi:hypothetical protein
LFRYSLLRARCNGTEQTVVLPIRSSGEKNRVGAKISATGSIAANTNAPQPVDDDCLPVGVARLVDKLAGSRIVGVDGTVTEVSNQQLICQCPETRGRYGHAPGRIELAVLNESVKRPTIEIEGVDYSVADSCDVVVFLSILHGIGHNKLCRGRQA